MPKKKKANIPNTVPRVMNVPMVGTTFGDKKKSGDKK